MPPYTSRSAKDIQSLLTKKTPEEQKAYDDYISKYDGVEKNPYEIDREFDDASRSFDSVKEDYQRAKERYEQDLRFNNNNKENLSYKIAGLAKKEKYYGVSPFYFVKKEKDREKYEKTYRDLKQYMNDKDKESVENEHVDEKSTYYFKMMTDPKKVYNSYDMKQTLSHFQQVCSPSLGAGRGQWQYDEKEFKELDEDMKKTILDLNFLSKSSAQRAENAFNSSVSDLKEAQKELNAINEFKTVENNFKNGIEAGFKRQEKEFNERKKAFEAYREARNKGITKDNTDSAVKEYQDKRKEYKKLNIFQRIAAHFRNPETYEPARRLKELNDFEAVFKENKIDPNQKIEEAVMPQDNSPLMPPEGNQWAKGNNIQKNGMDLSNSMQQTMNSDPNYMQGGAKESANEMTNEMNN